MTRKDEFHTFNVRVLKLTQKAMLACKDADFKKPPNERKQWEFWLPLSQINITRIQDTTPAPIYTVEIPAWICEEKDI